MMIQQLIIWCAILPAQSAASVDELADRYVDGTYGFSIRPPKDWSLVRRRVSEANGAALLRMVQEVAPDITQEIVLKQISTARKLSIDEMLKRIDDSLQLEFTQIEVQSRQVQQIAGRPGGVLSARFVHDGAQKLRIEAIVELKAKSYLVLLYDGPAELGKKSEPLFHLVLGSLQLLVDQMNEAEIKRALAAGEKLLTGMTAAALKKAIIPSQYLRVDVGGQAKGLMVIEESEVVTDGNGGVRILERGWTFEPKGQARRMHSTMFVSFDLKHERWKTVVTTLVPATNEKPANLEFMQEEGLRSQDLLLTNQTYQWNEAAETNPPMHVPKTYVSRGLIRLLPSLLADLETPRTLSFVTFDHARGALIARVVELKGQSHAPGGRSKGEAYLIKDREGLAAEESEIYVDGSGRVLYAKAGNVTMRSAEAKELETQFTGRIAEAEQGIAQVEEAYRRDEERFGRKAKVP